MINPPLYLKLISTAALSVISIILYVIYRTPRRKLLMVAMLLSTFGDVFMTDSVGMGDYSIVPGAAGFIAAHIVYAVAFILACKKNNYKYFNAGFFTGVGITAVTIAVLGVLAFTASSNPQPTMYALLCVYLIVIGFNMSSNFAYSFKAKGQYIAILPAAIVLFLITDVWIFLKMLYIEMESIYLVWHFYPLAQLLLIVFGDTLKKKKA